MSMRLTLARLANRLLPPLVSNRLTLHYIYPYERALRDDPEFRSKAVTGSYYHGTLRDVHGYMFGMHGYFDWRVIAVAGAVLKAGDEVVEVGANVGTETIALADLVGPSGKVLAIEPVTSNLERLRALNERSGLRHVEVIESAVSDFEGSVEFAQPADLAHSGLGHIYAKESGGVSTLISVPCTTLDQLLARRGPVRLITIDAEGAELGILRGARASLERDRPVLLVEACGPHLRRFGGGLSDLHGELEKQGYRVYQIAKLGLREPSLGTDQQTNWVGLPQSMAGEAVRISQRLFACGVIPCVPGLNPLTRHAQ
jgi:FkbM family methyltransferase